MNMDEKESEEEEKNPKFKEVEKHKVWSGNK